MTQNTSRGESTATGRSIGGTLRRAATTMITPERKVGKAPGVLQGIKSILLSSCESVYYWKTIPALTNASYLSFRAESSPSFHSCLCAPLSCSLSAYEY